MEIALAGTADLTQLARLVWLHAAPQEQAQQDLPSFTADLAAWWEHHDSSHIAFVAGDQGVVVGMAWLALVARVPRPGALNRLSGDVQSVYVLEDHRGRGIGSALVRAATEHATAAGVARVTVQSGRRAVPVYERLGFSSSPQLLQWPR